VFQRSTMKTLQVSQWFRPVASTLHVLGINGVAQANLHIGWMPLLRDLDRRNMMRCPDQNDAAATED
jgi:hypothetical protein